MKRITILILIALALSVIGVILLDIAFPEMTTKQSIALSFAIFIFYLYCEVLKHIDDID